MDGNQGVWECEAKDLIWCFNHISQKIEESQKPYSKVGRDEIRACWLNCVYEMSKWREKHNQFGSEKDYLKDCKKGVSSLVTNMNQHDREQARFSCGDSTPKTGIGLIEANIKGLDL